MTPANARELLVARLKQRALLSSSSALLAWDEATSLPAAGARHRAAQLAQLAGLAHELLVDPRVGEWLDVCPDDVDVRHWRRLYRRANRVPRPLVEALAKACTLAREAWVAARDANDGALLVPHLTTVVELKREEAQALANGGDRYEAMLDEHEPFVIARATELLLETLGHELLRRASAWELGPCQPPPDAVPRDVQLALAQHVASHLGFSPRRGRLDAGSHANTFSVGPGDIRATICVNACEPLESILSALHQLGHWLAEDGLRPEAWGTPSGALASVSLHESQARLLENHVGRSGGFWEWLCPTLKAHWAPHYDAATPHTLRHAVRHVHRGQRRAGADEVTYDLHIVLRTRLERALIDGALEVKDLPGAWSDGAAWWFGTRPRDELEGWLQDGHWSAGLFGYFPTYTLGNLAAAQLAEALRRERPDLEHELARGEFTPTLRWLRETVHRHGSDGNVFERVQAATGQPLTAQAFLRHLDLQYGPGQR